MSKKKTQHSASNGNTSNSSASNGSVQRPRVLGWLILAAGGFSSWYWYKPLPPEVGRAAYSDWDHSTSGKKEWNDSSLSETSLIRPSLDELEEVGLAPTSTPSELNNSWVGTRRDGLIPVPNQSSSLSDILSSEPQPTAPELTAEVRSVQSLARPWVEGMSAASSESSNKVSNKIASEFSAAPWPDTVYRQQPVERESAIPSSIPPLLNPGQQHFASSKIRTQENEAERSKRSPMEQDIPAPPSRPPIDRTPLFIRQPKK